MSVLRILLFALIILAVGTNIRKSKNALKTTRKRNRSGPILTISVDLRFGNRNSSSTETNPTAAISKISSFPPNTPKIAIGIVSAFDWADPPDDAVVTFRARRQMHRDTWMQHPAVNRLNGPIQVYFIIGNKLHESQGFGKATYPIEDLEMEMKHHGDILLLDSPDMHNFGKMNAWYEWAAAMNETKNSNNSQFHLREGVDYHVKLDDETYVNVDQLLEELTKAPRHQFFGGLGHIMRFKYIKIFWLIGWAYILSNDFLVGLGECSLDKNRLPPNNGTHEDVYTGYALRVCGLYDARNAIGLTYAARMKSNSLLFILSSGCPEENINGIIFIHGGCGRENNPFRTVGPQTFSILHSVYHPEPADTTSEWAKWERLRHLYLDVMGACSAPSMKEDWICVQGWEARTCIPTEEDGR